MIAEWVLVHPPPGDFHDVAASVPASCPAVGGRDGAHLDVATDPVRVADLPG